MMNMHMNLPSLFRFWETIEKNLYLTIVECYIDANICDQIGIDT